ncbi:hypothetical protein JVX90_00290 [Gordonia sp. PDNC005]|uniref:hypothetical protein n=1 Tax=Gordonia sp. PDNC005 TaxID=2811424 RepID=UPI001963CF33|nr:hypothetical protein [Gordonia sp. PDNC005]QRY62751.1 hypothetical protein JVX90_00290 [Gordonia sp. PDNC005]
MPNTVWPSVHARRMRLTKVDSCGVPVTGAANKSMLVTKGIVKVSITSEIEDGEETLKKNGSGEICVNYKDPNQVKYLSAEIEFCGVDPEAWSMITGQPLVVDADGNAIGVKISSKPIEANFALEVWTDIPGGSCASGFQPFGYFLLPFIGSGTIGDLELSVSAAEFTLSAQTKPGTGWGAGPYAVQRDEDGDAGLLLDPMTADDPALFIQVDVPPPAPTEGAVMLTPFVPTP